jgi:hypothetical protein
MTDNVLVIVFYRLVNNIYRDGCSGCLNGNNYVE